MIIELKNNKYRVNVDNSAGFVESYYPKDRCPLKRKYLRRNGFLYGVKEWAEVDNEEEAKLLEAYDKAAEQRLRAKVACMYFIKEKYN